jgi:hypothetical protein
MVHNLLTQRTNDRFKYMNCMDQLFMTVTEHLTLLTPKKEVYLAHSLEDSRAWCLHQLISGGDFPTVSHHGGRCRQEGVCENKLSETDWAGPGSGFIAMPL